MKCIFRNEECIAWNPGGHDNCRRCRYVPDMIDDLELQYRYLCAIASQREKAKKYYGSINRKIPAWFERILAQDAYSSRSYFDHLRTFDKSSIISEPYNVHMEDLRDLIALCDKNDLEFFVDGNAAWFPGRTFRICITRKKK